MGPSGFIVNYGQPVEIRRDGKVIRSRALPPGKEPFITCFPNTDILPGDEIHFVLGQKSYPVAGIEPFIKDDEVLALKVFYATKSETVTPTVVNNHIYNPVYQINSPGACQTVTFGAEQKEVVREAIRLALGIVDELNLDANGKAELKAEAAVVETKLHSASTRWESLRGLLREISSKIRTGIASKVSDAVLEQGGRAVGMLQQLLS